MTFDNIHNDTACDCVDDAKQDVQNVYARKINKPEILDKDFKSHWEKGKRAEDSNCKLVCGYKGLSVSIWNEVSEQDVINKYVTTFSISPKSKDSIYIFKFKEDAGLLKYTPNPKDAFHYDFYKCDSFTLEMLEGIEIKELKSFLKEK